MKITAFTILCGVLGLLVTSPQTARSQDSSAPASLEVHVNYSGAGTVDEKHKIYVALWDSPDFVSGNGAPFAMQPVSSKNGSVNFDDVKVKTVYVSTVYDASGTWDAQSVPPDGSPLGLYSKTPGKPEPVDLKPGKKTSIEVPFDDTIKMKSGQAAR